MITSLVNTLVKKLWIFFLLKKKVFSSLPNKVPEKRQLLALEFAIVLSFPLCLWMVTASPATESTFKVRLKADAGYAGSFY